jgi:transcriptional regulator with XRE-family HTH domain
MPQWDREAASYIATGKRLSHLRGALGLTQRQIAGELNITGPRWANYEVGTSRIPVDVALQLVKRWGVSLDWIYYGSEAIMPKELLRKIKAAAKESASRVERLSKERK